MRFAPDRRPGGAPPDPTAPGRRETPAPTGGAHARSRFPALTLLQTCIEVIGWGGTWRCQGPIPMPRQFRKNAMAYTLSAENPYTSPDRSRRVATLIASATEIVSALGCRDWIVGRSHECDYPESISAVPVL